MNNQAVFQEKLPDPAKAVVSAEAIRLPGKKKQTYGQVMIHVLVWLLLFSFMMSFPFFFRQPGFEDVQWALYIKISAHFVSIIALFYFNAYYLIPAFLFRRKVWQYTVVITACVCCIGIINWRLNEAIDLDAIMEREMRQHLKNFPANGNFGPPLRINPFEPFSILTVLLVIGVSTSLKVTTKWFKDAESQQELEKERLSSELSLLKSQINPHFFFNTLNNIYALTEANPRFAQEAIHRLSKLMRYVLYESEHGEVPLSREIEFIRHYVELVKLRVTDRVHIEFDYPSDGQHWQIAPLLFIPFIENAFKHGVSYQDKSYVYIKLEVKEGKLHFLCRNRMLNQHQEQDLEGSGIGLANVKRRLELLYGDRHWLVTLIKHSEYVVDLTIKL